MNKNSSYMEINREKFISARKYFSSAPRRYQKGEIIMKQEDLSGHTALIISGLAVMKSINDNGEESILDFFEKGDIFGGIFTPHENVNLYYIAAKKTCDICFRQDINTENYSETNNKDLFEFLNTTASNIFSRQMLHTDILTQRSIRNKLLTYFSALSSVQGKNFTLPLSLTDTADYLAVDRSAMMRELKKLNDEGIICSKGQRILLIDE